MDNFRRPIFSNAIEGVQNFEPDKLIWQIQNKESPPQAAGYLKRF